MSEAKVFSIIFNANRGQGRREKVRRLRNVVKEVPIECNVFVPPSMHATKNNPVIDKKVEGIDRIFKGVYFNDMTTNSSTSFLPELRDDVSIEEISPPHLTRCSDVGSVIQPLSHAQYNMKIASGSSSSRNRPKRIHSRHRLQGDINKHKSVQARLPPMITEHLDNSFPNIYLESPSSALEAIQREINQVIIQPKSRRGGTSEQQGDSRDQDCLSSDAPYTSWKCW